MKTVTGCLAVLLGVVGAILCVAVCGLAWWGAFELAGQVDQLVGRADEGLTTVDDALGRVNGKVDSTASAVGTVRESAALVAGGTPQTDPLHQARGKRLLDELSPPLDRADALADSLQALGTVLQNTADSIGQFDRGRTPAGRLRSAADKLGAAVGALGSVRDRAATLRQGGTLLNTRDIVRLADEAKGALDRLAGGLSDVRLAVGDVRRELPEVRRTASTWKVAGPAIVTVILFWVGLGQLCLIGWGRRRLASRTAPPAVPSRA